jgi:hypothetical protein
VNHSQGELLRDQVCVRSTQRHATVGRTPGERRRWLNQSTHSTTAISTSLTDFQPVLGRVAGLWISSALNSELNASAGLDQHQVRRWISWFRWTILAMLAYAFVAATEQAENPTTQESSLIALTCNEIKRLFNFVRADPIRDLRHRLHCSIWGRRHRHRARTSHYRPTSPRSMNITKSGCRPGRAAETNVEHRCRVWCRAG